MEMVYKGSGNIKWLFISHEPLKWIDTIENNAARLLIAPKNDENYAF